MLGKLVEKMYAEMLFTQLPFIWVFVIFEVVDWIGPAFLACVKEKGY